MSYRAFAVVLAAVLCLCSAPAVVSAEVSTSVQTSYDGTQPDADQAVQVTYTISPEGDTVNNLTVDLDSTSGSFIESRSSSYTISPGGAGVSVEGRPGDRYFIRELNPSEEVTITFQVYPKQIKREELDVAVVSADYIQNGQQLSRSDTVTADLSASPWFALQTSERRADSLQRRITGMRTLMFGGAGVGVLGALAAFGTLLWKRRAISGLKQDLSDELDKLATRMQSQGLEDGSTEHKEFNSWRREMADEYGIDFTGGIGPTEPAPGPGNPFDGTDDTDEGGFGDDTDEGGFGDDTGGFDGSDDDTGGFGGSDDD
ncbi:hypothetical protein [Halobellus ruber]|uniref:Uncharacterized protein n=1 Tax=Halobellus ruber TaxID=2761102 RepID=A0A7J9SK74_9EURY|nr:hypothetical protein [Halobellus ruber]MBB6647354.1 hypothetical protein [Halobellus ruber]